MKKVGTIHFGSTVDITDPCYDRSVFCRINDYPIVEGDYSCNLSLKDYGDWGTRVNYMEVFHKGFKKKNCRKVYIGSIGVDAGLAGVFSHKKDYSDEEWQDFCKKLPKDKQYMFLDNGFFTESGFGDGVYNVLGYKTAKNEIVGIKILF